MYLTDVICVKSVANFQKANILDFLNIVFFVNEGKIEVSLDLSEELFNIKIYNFMLSMKFWPYLYQSLLA